MHICIKFQSVFLIFFIERLRKNLLNVTIFDFSEFTGVTWALQRKIVVIYLGFEGLRETVFMENMRAILERKKLFLIEPNIADLANGIIDRLVVFG